MSPPPRRRTIVELARRHGEVSVDCLAGRLGVTPETVRRDLRELERDGLVNRTRGGALPAERSGYESPLELRAQWHGAEKGRIARRALAEISDAHTVYLDGGSTTGALAAALRPERMLTVVTPSMAIADQLTDRPHVAVIQLAGTVNHGARSVSGPWAMRMLSTLAPDLAVLGTSGVSRQHGYTGPDPAATALKRAAIRRSRRTVVVADASKFGRDSFASFAQIEDVDLLVASAPVPRTVLDQLRAADARVELV